MSAIVDCPACMWGEHERHIGPWNVREGLIGGAVCCCPGDCAKRRFDATKPWFPSSLPSDCPNGPHRGPQGPNEDVAQCPVCWSLSWCKRPSGETFGHHRPDCSLPIDHESYCQPEPVGGER